MLSGFSRFGGCHLSSPSLHRVGAWIAAGVLTSAVVWLAALPLVALWFHLVSPIGILLNIPLIPLTSLALLLGAAGMGLGMVWSPLAALPIQAADALLRLTELIVRWGALRSWGHRFVPGPSWGTVAAFYFLLLLATVAGSAGMAKAIGPRGRGWRIALWCAVLTSTLPGWLLGGPGRASATMEGELLAVGHGLAVVLQLPDGQAILYDCGRMGDPRVGAGSSPRCSGTLASPGSTRSTLATPTRIITTHSRICWTGSRSASL